MAESFGKNDTFVPFSNGHEHRMWLDCNCHRGDGCRRYNPNAATSRHGCAIEVAIAFANVNDGDVPVRIGLRGGFLEPGPGGRLVRVDADKPYAVIPECPEYKGRDEPPDPPTRPRRPPGDQMDLLDPRNAPDRERVHG